MQRHLDRNIKDVIAEFKKQFLAAVQVLIYAGAITVLIIFAVMLLQRATGRIVMAENQHLIGGVFALYVSGLYLSVPASVGFVVLFGVAVLNGVVLVSHIAELRASGKEPGEAIRKGAEDRLRPVIMTASIAVFSLIPMLLASGPGSEIQRPLATVVVGGLITSTLLTLLVLPALGFLLNTWLGLLLGLALYLGSRVYTPEEEDLLETMFGASWQSYRRSVKIPWL